MTATYLAYGLAGALAGLLRDLLIYGGLVLPHTELMKDGAKLLRLGFILAMALGAGAGIWADHHWFTAALAGWAGPDALERVANARASWKRRRQLSTARERAGR